MTKSGKSPEIHPYVFRIRSPRSLAWTFCPILLAAISVGDPFVLKTTDGQTTVTSVGFQWKQINPKESRYLFTGGVKARMLKANVTITADHAVALATTAAGKTRLSTITAFQGVKLVTTRVGPSGSEISTLTSNEIEFLNNRDDSVANCKGLVVLTQVGGKKNQTLHATGGSGKAVFTGNSESKNNRLSTATLYSPVDILIDQAPTEGAKADKTHITCSQMIYKPGTTQGTVELSGNVHVTSKTMGTASNFGKVTIHLNAKHEAEDFNGSAG